MKKILLTLLFLAPAFIAFAQPGGDPTPVPIDGGIGLLAAAGIAYGVKKFREGRR